MCSLACVSTEVFEASLIAPHMMLCNVAAGAMRKVCCVFFLMSSADNKE